MLLVKLSVLLFYIRRWEAVQLRFRILAGKPKVSLADRGHCSLSVFVVPFTDYLIICRSSEQGLHFRPEVYSDDAECHWNGMLDSLIA